MRKIRERETFKAIIIKHRIGLLPVFMATTDNVCEIEEELVIIKNLQHCPLLLLHTWPLTLTSPDSASYLYRRSPGLFAPVSVASVDLKIEMTIDTDK